jgi:hypothetical protein
VSGERRFILWHLGVAIALLAVGLWISGCAAFEPEGATPMVPPASYRAIWDSAQACTGRRGDFDRVRFYVVPDTFSYDGHTVAGLENDRGVYIAAPYLDHPLIVKHEMIHALGFGGHPNHPFKDPCKATWDTYTPTPKLALGVGGSAGGLK